MLRVRMDQAHLKRTIRPLYGWTQTTPKSAFLFLNEDGSRTFSTPVYPGMVMMHVGGEEYDLADTEPASEVGLSGLYIGGDGIDEVADQGVNAIAVWVLGPDAEFEILAPAFDPDVLDATEGDLLGVCLSGPHIGKLTHDNNASSKKVARLLKIVSDSKIIVGGLQGTA